MFRFTIRDVLWLTVVVGLALGWLADHRELKQYGEEYWTAFDVLKAHINADGYKITLTGEQLVIVKPNDAGTTITILKD